MTRTWHRAGTLPLLFSATETIELAAGGGLGCPDGAARGDERSDACVKVELKIWRYDASTGDRALRPYEVDVSDEATLLDTLDAVKDKVDGTLAYRKSCRMMICGSCGMRVDGGAVLACKDADRRHRR